MKILSMPAAEKIDGYLIKDGKSLVAYTGGAEQMSDYVLVTRTGDSDAQKKYYTAPIDVTDYSSLIFQFESNVYPGLVTIVVDGTAYQVGRMASDTYVVNVSAKTGTIVVTCRLDEAGATLGYHIKQLYAQ